MIDRIHMLFTCSLSIKVLITGVAADKVIVIVDMFVKPISNGGAETAVLTFEHLDKRDLQ